MDNRQVQLERSNHVLTAMGVDTRNAKVMDRTQYLTFDGKGKSSVVLLIDSNTKKLVRGYLFRRQQVQQRSLLCYRRDPRSH